MLKLKPLKRWENQDYETGSEKSVKTRAHVFVTGRVQGVFFRLKTKRIAEHHNVKGWIRNLPDGRVETVFEGEKEDVEILIAFCKHGPSEAKVTNFELMREHYTGTFNSFKVKYS